MNRSILSALAVAALTSAVALSADEPTTAEAPTTARPESVVDASCKPLAPIAVTLTEAGRSGPFVELAYEVRPLRELRDVTWELQLPDDATLIEGQRLGQAAGARDASTRGQVRVAMPVDDVYRRARLVAHAVMTGSDEHGNTFDEPIAVSRTLGWGTPEPVGAVVLTPDAETGANEPVVVLKTAHRPGR